MSSSSAASSAKPSAAEYTPVPVRIFRGDSLELRRSFHIAVTLSIPTNQRLLTPVPSGLALSSPAWIEPRTVRGETPNAAAATSVVTYSDSDLVDAEFCRRFSALLPLVFTVGSACTFSPRAGSPAMVGSLPKAFVVFCSSENRPKGSAEPLWPLVAPASSFEAV